MAKISPKKYFEALEYQDDDTVQRALEQGADPNLRYDKSQSFLARACWYGHERIVQLLLEHGAKADQDKGDPLFSAILSGSDNAPEIIGLLAARGADINRFHKKMDYTDHPGTPMVIALQRGALATVRKLIELGARVDIKDEDGWTAFTHTAVNGYYKIGKALLESGCPVDENDETERALRDRIQNGGELHDQCIETVYAGHWLRGPKASSSPHFSGLSDLSKVFTAAAFPGCANPPIHLLSIDLSQFPDLPSEIKALGVLPVVWHSCEDCDDPDYAAFLLEEDHRLTPFESESEEYEGDTRDEDNVAEQDEGNEEEASDQPDEEDSDDESPSCSPRSALKSKKTTFMAFKPIENPNLDESGILIGGLPDWVQSPDWIGCECCGGPTFYLGSIYQFSVPPGAGGPGNHLYLFLCAKCRTLNMVRQMT